MCLYVGVQETFSTISGLVWEAVLYLNSKQSCLSFSERRDNLLRADVFVSTSVMEVSGSPKLPLCAGLITAYLRKGIWGCIALLQGQVWKLSGQWEQACAIQQRKGSRTELSAYCLSTPIHISVLCASLLFVPPCPCSKLKILEICNNISTWPYHAEAAKEK